MNETGKTLWGAVRILPENESAVTACRWVVASGRGRGKPPFLVLFLHGEPGTGKSHLVRTLCRKSPQSVLTSAADFSRDETDGDAATAPLLVIEDVHRLPVVAVERLVTLLDRRTALRRLTVFTAANSPFELRSLPKRLTSRLGGGLTVAVRAPSAESRLAVLTAHVRSRRQPLKRHDLVAIANEVTGGYRELFGAADALALERNRVRRPVRPDRPEPRPPKPSRRGADDLPLSDLIGDVARAFRLPPADIRGPGQLKTVVTARQTFAYLAKVVLNVPHSHVTNFLNRSPSSLVSATNDLRWKMVRDPALHAIVTTLESDWRAKARKVVARLATEASEAARDPDDM